MQPTPKSLSILIPNYNGKELLKEFLPYTIAAAKNTKLPFEIIVVDDASTDDSVCFLKENHPEVTVIRNKTNQGFSITCNVGIQSASYDLLLLLNTDIQLSPDFFETQLRYFTLPETFGVMSRIIDYEKPNHIERPKNFSRVGFRLKKKSTCHVYNKNNYYPTAFLSGANALVDTKKIKLLGGFNPLFSPFYSEDTELSIRAWRMGWKCYFDSFASCKHLGSHTIKNSTKKKQIKTVYYRNKFILHALHLNRTQNILFDLQAIFQIIIPKLIIGNSWILKSYTMYLNHKKDIVSSREQFESLAKEHNSTIKLFDISTIIKKLTPTSTAD